ncbi:MAG: hypothetical protein IID40_07940, partial [Planctomycetes bacterium]|nr:hypothetical protein [Planctomycetota bacterium]
MNLSEDGSIGDSFVAGASGGSSTNVEVNITGGVVGEDFAANSGSTINISGGNIGTFFYSLGWWPIGALFRISAWLTLIFGLGGALYALFL